MGKFLFKRFCYMILVLWVVITATFFLMNTLPGDPIANKVKQLPPETVKIMQHKYGLDKPVYIRYVKYLGRLIQGDFGESMLMPGQSVAGLIREKFPASARFGLQALVLGLTGGLLLGIIAAFRRNTWVDYLVIFIAILAISTPSFVFAAIVQKYLGNTFQIAGWEGASPFFPKFEYTILPTIAVALREVGGYARYMKAQVTDIMNSDYILTAKAKGVKKSKIVWRHILRNAMIPLVTMLPVTVAYILCGNFVIEKIFAIPGIGREFLVSITNRDYTLILGTTCFLCMLYVVALLAVDLLYGIVDPRIRVGGGKK